MPVVLVTDDDPMIVDVVGFLLTREGFEVAPALDAATALDCVARLQPALGIIDINLGASSGFDLVEQIRQTTRMPVLLLSARTSEDDKVRGLRLGADDYLTKPFGHQELLARVHAHLRRARRVLAAAPPAEMRVGPLVLDRPSHRVSLDGQPLRVTPTEFGLLECLMAEPGHVVAHAALTAKLWGDDGRHAQEAARVALHRLRHKLGTYAGVVRTIPGVGVMITAGPGGEGRPPL